MRSVTKAIALTKTAFEAAQQRQLEWMRGAIVFGCASALILAGQPLPL